MWKLNLVQDAHGLYATMYLKPRAVLHHTGAFSCQSICEHNLKRPHATCLWCRGRRIYMKKMPSKIRAIPYMLLIDANRKHAWLKGILLKRVLTIAEMLAN